MLNLNIDPSLAAQEGKLKRSQLIKAEALKQGFDLVGIARPQISEEENSFFDRWLSSGFAGSMQYISKNSDKRKNPYLILPSVKSVLCFGLNYYTKESTGPISNYAWGDDYHDVFLKKLNNFSLFLKSEFASHIETKEYVDTGPLLERSLAAQAGLGWIGKNTCLINKNQGSYFFLGEILTNLELAFDSPATDHCGSCTACLDACPTQAFTQSGILDSNKCISYLTIEYREEEFPEDLKDKMGHHFYGCDICQQACPWNSKAQPCDEKSFYPRDDFENPDLRKWQSMTEEEFHKKFRNSPMKRAKHKGLLRNIQRLIIKKPKVA
ncbi:MAG: tRNA epoxyqueuosine(34) reductase QueG [Deltaproteobacteria bacterium]|nr:tRNA epoxyqueuosine(34) reductase QueG [Deltaproteobacteria bacterium]